MQRPALSRLLCLCLFTAPLAVAADPPPRLSLIESYRRQDPTGRGSFHRFGLFRELDNSQSLAAEAGLTPEPTEEEKAGWQQSLGERLSMQFRAHSMLFASDNIFNTEQDAQSDSQFAQFVGVSLDAQLSERWKFANSFDQAWFLHGKSENSGSDFVTSTFRQALSYDRYFFDNKVGLTVPLSWQFSRLSNRSTGNRTLDTWSYGAATEFSWFLSEKVIPTFSYQYSFQDSGSPQGPVSDKHKHDLNLGLTLIPIPDVRFYVIPSVQYSHEHFSQAERRDNAWTPTLTLSWQPLDFLAVDAVASHTDSQSSLRNSSFDALTGTLFVRLFYNW